MATAMTVAALSALGQEEGPILLPKPKPVAKLAGSKLLIMCDMACNWKLDGEAKGRIEAGGSAMANVVLGQHVVAAATLDGLDKVEDEIEVKSAVQMIVHLALQPVRDARFKAEQEARDKADQEAREKAAQEVRDKAAREEHDKEQKQREQAAQERQEREQTERERAAQAEAAGLVWADLATGLMWTRNDNGSAVNWHQATDYCRNLQLGGYSNWRLPTIDELRRIYDANVKVGNFHVKGNLQLSGWEWSNSQGEYSDQAWLLIFKFNTAKWVSFSLGNRSHFFRALCVRRFGE
jgi:hypothetical protein